MASGVKPPVWFWIVALLLVVWEGFGFYMCVEQFRIGPASWGVPVDDWARTYYAALPVWYNWVYAVATFGGLLGALALLLRERRASILFWISFIAIIAMFGYTFAATDMIAHKGVAEAVPFPVVIALVGAFAIWFSGMATRKGWIGR